MASTDVAEAAITSGAGNFGAAKAAGVRLMRAYLASVELKPKHPWFTPPKSV